MTTFSFCTLSVPSQRVADIFFSKLTQLSGEHVSGNRSLTGSRAQCPELNGKLHANFYPNPGGQEEKEGIII